jgi:hypothetical protein
VIWEHTCPAPLLIEAAFCFPTSEAESDDLDSSGEEDGYTILYPVGSLSAALKEGLFKKCPEPVALPVCQESLRHTQTKYIHISHAHTLAGSFYFSPSRDVLYLPVGIGNKDTDVDDEYCHPDPLQDSYGHQLVIFETVLIDDSDWVDVTPTAYSKYF